MLYVAWRTGKGYRTIGIVVASTILFEFVRAAIKLPDGVWVFGLALISAAVANWFIGRKLNRKSLAKVKTREVRQRLLYRAPHKFMSLPMKTFSILLAVGGAAIIACSMVGVIWWQLSTQS